LPKYDFAVSPKKGLQKIFFPELHVESLQKKDLYQNNYSQFSKMTVV